MPQSSRSFQSSGGCLQNNHQLLRPPYSFYTVVHRVQTRCIMPFSCPSPILKHSNYQFSRRDLAIFTNTSLLLLVNCHTLLPNSQAAAAAAEEEEYQESPAVQTFEKKTVAVEQEDGDIQTIDKTRSTQTNEYNAVSNENKSPSIPDRAFLDISIGEKPIGRIIIALDRENAPTGSSRFSDLVSGKAGISYRRKEFIKITPNYVQHAGVRSYGVDAEMARKTGGKELSNASLIEEWERMKPKKSTAPGTGGATNNLAGTVSIIVRDPSKPPPKIKLVARKGKLEIDQEEVGVEPNGTEFVIATKDTPELDDSALVIGRVVQGMDVAHQITQVKTVQDNTTSPYFRVAKLIGDKRAVVAERGFNRPYTKVLVTNCGLMD